MSIFLIKKDEKLIKNTMGMYSTIFIILCILSLFPVYTNYNSYVQDSENYVNNNYNEYSNTEEGLYNFITDIMIKENFPDYNRNKYDCSNFTILLGWFLEGEGFNYQFEKNDSHMWLTVKVDNKNIKLNTVMLSKQKPLENLTKSEINQKIKTGFEISENKYDNFKPIDNYKSYKKLLLKNIKFNKINKEYTWLEKDILNYTKKYDYISFFNLINNYMI
ncbi:MAG: hypothetical protein ACOCP8_04155 [archaeon]